MTGYWATIDPYAIIFVGICMVTPGILLGIDLARDWRKARRTSQLRGNVHTEKER